MNSSPSTQNLRKELEFTTRCLNFVKVFQKELSVEDIYIFEMLPKVNDVISGKSSSGDLEEIIRIAQIWNSPSYKSLRKKFDNFR